MKPEDKRPKSKDKNMAQPIESHETAAWTNKEDTQPITNVRIPSQNQVQNAKEWVDSNEK